MSKIEIDIFKLIDGITGHTDISASESYDNKSYENMKKKIYIINGLISDLEENLLHKRHKEFYSVEKLKKQARDYLKEIRDFCQEILDEESDKDEVKIIISNEKEDNFTGIKVYENGEEKSRITFDDNSKIKEILI